MSHSLLRMTFNVTFHNFNQESLFVQLQMWLFFLFFEKAKKKLNVTNLSKILLKIFTYFCYFRSIFEWYRNTHIVSYFPFFLPNQIDLINFCHFLIVFFFRKSNTNIYKWRSKKITFSYLFILFYLQKYLTLKY